MPISNLTSLRYHFSFAIRTKIKFLTFFNIPNIYKPLLGI